MNEEVRIMHAENSAGTRVCGPDKPLGGKRTALMSVCMPWMLSLLCCMCRRRQAVEALHLTSCLLQDFA